MNRRYFLGAALSAAAAAPSFAMSTFDRHRILSFHHLHTDARMSVVYKVGGVFQAGALQRLNYFFRDFRNDQEAVMDPRLFDLLFDVKMALGDPDASFEVISGYRSPSTNAALRRVSSGVARNSLHVTGQAIDVRFPDLPTRYIRDAALELGRGGVGYYRRADFVHLDTGTVRRWGA